MSNMNNNDKLLSKVSSLAQRKRSIVGLMSKQPATTKTLQSTQVSRIKLKNGKYQKKLFETQPEELE